MREARTRTRQAAQAVLADVADGHSPMMPSELRKHPGLCRNGKPRDVGFVHRMFARGARCADGTLLPLPYAIGPGGRFSTGPAVNRWLQALNGSTAGPSPRAAADAHDRAESRLAALGI